MRIAVLHSRYLSGEASGENRVVEDEVSLLRDAGHEVITWTPEPRIRNGRDRLQAGIDTIWGKRAVGVIRGLISRRNVDVVHFHNLFPTLSPAAVRVAGLMAPVVMTLHNYRLFCLPATLLRDGVTCELCIARPPWRGVQHRCYRGSALGSAALATSLTLHRSTGSFDRVARFLAVSQFVKDKHVQAGIPAERILVKPNFANEARRREGPGDYFLYLGRLSPEKGVATLISAWGKFDGARLVIAGSGPDEAALRSTSHPNVEFLGQVNVDRVSELVARARALLLPALSYEGSPRSVLEAFAGGVPVVASRLGALETLVADGITGLLVDGNDEAAWRLAGGRLRSNEMSETMGEAAYQTWQALYTPHRALANLESAYADAIDDFRKRGSA